MESCSRRSYWNYFQWIFTKTIQVINPIAIYAVNLFFICSDLDKGELLKTLLQPDDDRIEFKMFNSIITTYLESKQAKSS